MARALGLPCKVCNWCRPVCLPRAVFGSEHIVHVSERIALHPDWRGAFPLFRFTAQLRNAGIQLGPFVSYKIRDRSIRRESWDPGFIAMRVTN
jgi:hypothetical protein